MNKQKLEKANSLVEEINGLKSDISELEQLKIRQPKGDNGVKVTIGDVRLAAGIHSGGLEFVSKHVTQKQANELAERNYLTFVKILKEKLAKKEKELNDL